MSVYFAMVIPAVVALILFTVYQHKTRWWEFMIPFGVSVLFVLLTKLSIDEVLIQDTEYWGGWATRAEYIEPWDKKVPCSHDQYVMIPDGDGGFRKQFIGYAHSFDVEQHAAQWQLHDSNGISLPIDSVTFEGLGTKFGAREFVDMHRDFHQLDGNKFVTV